MKKWHMEGIVSGGQRSSRKLKIPEQMPLGRLAAAFAGRAKKEFILLRLLRGALLRVCRLR